MMMNNLKCDRLYVNSSFVKETWQSAPELSHVDNHSRRHLWDKLKQNKSGLKAKQPWFAPDLPLSWCWMRQPLNRSLYPPLSPLQPGGSGSQTCTFYHPSTATAGVLTSLSSGTTIVAFSLIRLSKAFFSLLRVVRYACSSTLPLHRKYQCDDKVQYNTPV